MRALLIFLFIHASSQLPDPLRRVPKIYNALITTKQKLLPSEAQPATTGQVFEPIGLDGDPVLLNPEAFRKMEGDVGAPQEPQPFMRSGEEMKMPAPVVFYPKYGVYQPYQSVLPYNYPYQQPLVYPFGGPVTFPLGRRTEEQPERVPEPVQAPQQPEEVQEEQQQNEEEEQPQQQPEEPSLSTSSIGGYVKNNRPSNSDIPDVPPPPPPVGAPKPQENTSS